MPSQKIKCPNCSAEISVEETVQEVPNFGKMLFSVLHCPACGFKLSDVMSLDFKKPSEYSARISTEKDQNIKIIKSSTGTVKIPELGILIEPGPASEGYYSNIEGLLERIQEVSQILLNSAVSKKEINAAIKSAEKIQKARDSKIPFTVRVLDPFGNSSLLGKGVKRAILSKSAAAKLKKPVLIL